MTFKHGGQGMKLDDCAGITARSNGRVGHPGIHGRRRRLRRAARRPALAAPLDQLGRLQLGMYVGAASNQCILHRQDATTNMKHWGWEVAVARDEVDAMHSPLDAVVRHARTGG